MSLALVDNLSHEKSSTDKNASQFLFCQFFQFKNRKVKVCYNFANDWWTESCVNKAIITPFTPRGDAAGMGKQCSRLTLEQYKHTPGVTIDINITGGWGPNI